MRLLPLVLLVEVEEYESDRSDESVRVDEAGDSFISKPVMTRVWKTIEGRIKVWALDGEYVSIYSFGHFQTVVFRGFSYLPWHKSFSFLALISRLCKL